MSTRATIESKKASDAKVAELLADAPRPIQLDFKRWKAAVAALDDAAHKFRMARVWGRRLGVCPESVFSKRSLYRKLGDIALLDKRYSLVAQNGNARKCLPPLAIKHLQSLAQDDSLTSREVIEVFSSQLKRWQEGDASAQIPGYDQPPIGNPPPGTSAGNLVHYLRPRPRKRSQRVIYEIVLQFRADGSATWLKRKART